MFFEQFHFPTGIEFEIDGKAVPLNCIWAHTKEQPRGRTTPFRFTVPAPRVEDIFLPKTPKPADQSWSEFVKDELRRKRDLGAESFCIQEWLSRARTCEHASRGDTKWVICSITNVVDHDDGVIVNGVVEEFAHCLY